MNAIAPIGHNGPPLTAYEAVTAHLEDLLTEARAWADGATVENQAQADEISRLLEDLRLGEKAADEARVTEKKPLDEAISEIQDRYNIWIAPLKNKTPGKVPLAVDALKRALKPFLDGLEAERRAAEAEARRVAEEAAQKAAEAMRATDAANLAKREAAEALVADARRAEADANRVAGAKVHALGGTRALGLKTTYTPVLIDGVAAARHYWTDRRAECEAFFHGLAVLDVREGRRTIPGFRIDEGSRL